MGFVGADLKALCQKAAYLALRRQMPALDAPAPTMTIDHTDFLTAFTEIKPSVLRSVEIESPAIKWEDIGGLDEIKQTLQEAVEGQLLYPELYQTTQAQAPKGVLLWGPLGTGKTLLAKAIASQARANFIAITGAELLSRWVGAAEQAVRDLFMKARQAAPCVIFIDEIDTLAPQRGGISSDGGVSERVLGQLLTELDGLQTSAGVLLIGATNRSEILDTALMRAGRFDLQLRVDLPDQSGRLAILTVHNQHRPLVGVNLTEWANCTERWNGADLALLSNQAALLAIRRYRVAGFTDPTGIKIETADFAQAYQQIQSRLF